MSSIYNSLIGGSQAIPVSQPSAPLPSGPPGVGSGSMPMHTALSALQASTVPVDQRLQLGPQIAWLSPDEIAKAKAEGRFSDRQAEEAMNVYQQHLRQQKSQTPSQPTSAKPAATPSLQQTATSFFNRVR